MGLIEQFNYLRELCMALEPDYKVSWYESEHVPVINVVQSCGRFEDTFVLTWYGAKKWVITAVRREFRPDDGDIFYHPIPVSDHLSAINHLDTALQKVHHRFAPPMPVVAIGHVSFDPVPGESDYVEPSV